MLGLIIANRFKGRKSVIGYELINEPWTANVFDDPLNLLPGIAGKKFLVSFYDKLQKAIREVDDEAVIFWEPVIYQYLIFRRKYLTCNPIACSRGF